MIFKRTVVSLFLFSAIVSGVCAVSSRYVFNTLSGKDKVLYNRMDDAILSCSEKADATGYSKEDCIRVYSDYLDDHPGVFWADTKISYTTELNKNGKIIHNVIFSYTHQENLKADKRTFVNLVEYFHKHIKDDPNDWFKLFHIYEYLASTIVYDNNFDDQSMWSVFFNGIGVCAGFARSFQYLALLENIPCLIVRGYERTASGKAGKVAHAWCMAQIEGKWYHFDPTWGVKDSNGNVDYTYFCRSRERMEKTHIIDNQYPLPEAWDDSLSYVNVRHRYLEKYDFATVINIAETSFRRGENLFTLEFSSLSELRKAIKDLITDKKIMKTVRDSGMDFKSYSYSFNKKGCTLTFSFRREM